ncbi:MAG: long-chain fatty acid--CoA ligase, partial [Ramlibacter sp.]|nr:long-chain fatty acid--CoA ligase [Ramlibacter sp.]
MRSQVHPTVVHMLAEAAAAASAAEALVCGQRRLSYTQYLRCVAGFAAELVDMGARGSRVALVCGNSLDMPVAMFAAHAAGAQAVPVNPAYTARELGHIRADVQPQVVVYDDAVAATVEPLCTALGVAQ